jgi:hypothetical protein
MDDNYYYCIFKNIFIEDLKDNIIILIYFNNFYNIIDNFSHIIKKKNIKINIITTYNEIYNKYIENIKGEDIEQNITIYNNEENIINIIFDYVYILHLFSLEYLEHKLLNLNNLIKKDSNIYIYCSLSNENKTNIDYKNYIRDYIKKYIKYNIGNLLSLTKTLNIIEYNNYLVKSIKVFKNNNYIIYGNNIVYEIIIYKKM